ncbi:MAG: HAMP domain-containing histidine kinase [Anaerolinea sp.]|nr:HAMP domain-containing histidine kinase [Anaerolinea sp.]
MTFDTQDILLKTFPALIHAQTEEELLAALGLCVNFEARMRLLYLDQAVTGIPTHVTAVASWVHHEYNTCDPLLNHTFPIGDCEVIRQLQHWRDPIWFQESGCFQCQSCPLLLQVRRFIAIKLYGTAVLNRPSAWHAVLLISWDQTQPFTRQEQYLFATLWETISMVASNMRLRTDVVAMNTELSRLNRLKDEFLRTISHELRTPLASIYTLADMLRQGLNTVDTPTHMEVVYQSSRHMLEMVNDLLDMASIQAGTMRVYLETYNLNDLLQEGVRALRPLAEQKGLSLRLQGAEAVPWVLIDPKRITQVLTNLLSNAIKFSTQGVIEVTAQCHDEEVVVSIRDEGIGIAPSDLETIFDPFQRIDSPIARRAGGTGLGLSIARYLVELHGGRLWVNSQLGAGATFSFSLTSSEMTK